MSRRSRAGQLPLNADINVVSLIDVMMLLMVIFMITAPMMQGGVDIALPQAQARPLEPHERRRASTTWRQLWIDACFWQASRALPRVPLSSRPGWGADVNEDVRDDPEREAGRDSVEELAPVDEVAE